MTRRTIGQLAAGALAFACFLWSLWASRSSSIPELRVYDGYFMLLGSLVVVGMVAPLVWRWPRERSLVAIALAATLGCIIPLIISALRHHIPLAARLRGAWRIGGADVVGPPLIIGFVALWFALREHGVERSAAAGKDHR